MSIFDGWNAGIGSDSTPFGSEVGSVNMPTGGVVTMAAGYEPDPGYTSGAGFLSDWRDEAKIGPFIAAGQGDTRPWYERVAEYGLSRAIDNHYGIQPVNRTSNPATFAGANGRTYTLNPAQPGTVGGMPTVLVVGIAAVAALLLLK